MIEMVAKTVVQCIFYLIYNECILVFGCQVDKLQLETL